MRPGAPVDLVAALLELESVSHVYAADRERREYHVLSRDGEGTVRMRDAPGGRSLYAYSFVGDDPLEYSSVATAMDAVGSGEYYDGDAWAAATRESSYPDRTVRIVQLLDGPNSGDLILDAAPGYEPWDQMQKGLHGTLRREHMVVPLLIHGPRVDVEKAERLFAGGRLPRTVDVYPTI